MKYQIPGQGELELNTVILDLNGTLSVGGKLVPGIKPRLAALKEKGFKVVFFTGNTRGDADGLARDLGIDWELATNGPGKATAASRHDPATAVSVGNGLIDLELMRLVKLSIVTLQAEGVHVQTLLASDIIVPSITDALDLLIDESRLIATLRK